jgi:hypothetical protein
MEPRLEPCDAHAAFIAAVGEESAMPLLYRCPDCEIYNIDPKRAVERAQVIINKLIHAEEMEL